MTRRAGAVVALVVLAAACAKFPVLPPAARPDLYVVLPGAGGSVGAIVVTSDGRETTLDRALMAARIGKPGAIETVTTTDAEVKGVFGPALTAQPPRPMTFLLYFLHDSDELTPESQATVAAIVSEIGRRAVPEVVVVGHTDTMGTDEHNDRLSMQRAQRVRSGLLARGLGLPASDVLAAGRGKRETLVPTADQVAEPRNRRVEVVVR